MPHTTADADNIRVGPGRRRDSARHQAVLDATRELLREVGYSSVNIDAIARRADVSRRLIYRWWRHKAQIVAEVLFDDAADGIAPDTGTLEGDVRVLVDSVSRRYMRREMAVGLPGLQADLIADPALTAEVEDRYTRAHIDRWDEVLSHAAARGEVGHDFDHAAVAHAVVGAISVLTQQQTFRRHRDLTDFVTQFAVSALR